MERPLNSTVQTPILNTTVGVLCVCKGTIDLRFIGEEVQVVVSTYLI